MIKSKSIRHDLRAPYWAAAMILFGVAGLSTISWNPGGFWHGYVLDMTGPAWNYILFRGLFTAYRENFWTRLFSPGRTFLLFVLICFGIETLQYFHVYDATFDPWDLLAYISILIPVHLLDRRQQLPNSRTTGKKSKLMKNPILIFLVLICSSTSLPAQPDYPENEDGSYGDLLTPEYYDTPEGEPFREEVNKMVWFARQTPFHHPLADSLGNLPAYMIRRGFGDGTGFMKSTEHHPAYDFYIGNGVTDVSIYAAHDGFVRIQRNAEKYRHFLSITSDIIDSFGNSLGKMVCLYGHIDLDLDSMDGLELEGQFVQRGQLVSRHLYAETMGGPHLHFEIRYYRPTDAGTEEFYGWRGANPDLTVPSSGPWTFGHWDPDTGYGYAHPENHVNSSPSVVKSQVQENAVLIYPNPASNHFKLKFADNTGPMELQLFDLTGKKYLDQKLIRVGEEQIDLRGLKSGIYFLSLSFEQQHKMVTMVKI